MFDRWVVILGLVIAAVTALTPVTIEMMRTASAKNKESVNPKADLEQLENVTSDMAKEYVIFLKKELEDTQRERDQAYRILQHNNIPIPWLPDSD